ncbi:hypothetical protein [Micromonospora sp. HUAS LYJ1]|uniref:hypothetical protein n=1 Tax=Micromonospora sp. HUAS LYJ1 TaxID=3061626 RepID=UPI002671CC7F|nr:hypothetical protein [Micromonospora sp. HUAS LYJ1]WKU02531.1 hypothetical protein Q2K16_16515 [Micromonospora sp. HUAS LYJ1]
MTSPTPVIEQLATQPYLGIRRTVTMETIGDAAAALADLTAWVTARGITPAGPDFLRYHVIDMARELEVEAGVPVPAGTQLTVEAPPGTGVLPAGRYRDSRGGLGVCRGLWQVSMVRSTRSTHGRRESMTRRSRRWAS